MVKIEQLPFNVSFLNNDRRILAFHKPITSIDIFEGKSGQLHPEGLFSPEIFGRVGEKSRARTFTHIDLNTQIFHPLIYKNIDKLSSFYSGILQGKKYAIWDKSKRVFEPSNELDGETGFGFFFKYFKDIEWERNSSDIRNLRIDVLEEFKEKGLYDFVMVMPASLRDLEEDKKGNVTQDEINDLYRTLLGVSRNIDTQFPENKFNDNNRLVMQKTFFAIYNLLFSYIEGKKGLIQGKFSKRNIENGTRSVLTAMDKSTDDVEGVKSVKVNDTVLGLFQTLKGTLPLVQHAFKGELISSIFGGSDGTAMLVNKKTLKQERTPIKTYTYDAWVSEDGVNKLINQFAEQELRHRPVLVEDSYLALLYRDDFGFRVVQDIEEIPKEKRENVSPITWAELFYYLIKPLTVELPVYVTRYPVNNMNSMVPGWLYLKSTVVGDALFEYDNDFNPKTEVCIYNEFPIRDLAFIDSVVVHPTKLPGLDGDFDGDTASADIGYSQDSIDEARALFNDVESWFDADGKLAQAFNSDTFNWWLNSTTGVVIDDGVN